MPHFRILVVVVLALIIGCLFAVSVPTSNDQALASVVTVEQIYGTLLSPSTSADSSVMPTPALTTTDTTMPVLTPTIDSIIATILLDVSKYKQKALRVEKKARHARTVLVKYRKVFHRSAPRKLKPHSAFDTWQARWTYYKARLKDFREWNLFYSKIVSPKGSGAARWWLLARYIGWPSHEKGNWIYCVTHESGGSRTIMNSIGAAGIMQIYPACRDWKNPIANIAAGLKKYWADRRLGHSGWRPWTTMWSRIGW